MGASALAEFGYWLVASCPGHLGLMRLQSPEPRFTIVPWAPSPPRAAATRIRRSPRRSRAELRKRFETFDDDAKVACPWEDVLADLSPPP